MLTLPGTALTPDIPPVGPGSKATPRHRVSSWNISMAMAFLVAHLLTLSIPAPTTIDIIAIPQAAVAATPLGGASMFLAYSTSNLAADHTQTVQDFLAVNETGVANLT